MTTKPKPRKAPPKAHAGTPNDCGEISKLLARYRFLEADQKHNAAIAETVVLLVGVVVATDLFLAARSAHSDVISSEMHEIDANTQSLRRILVQRCKPIFGRFP
jgi:hypothetical protein